MMSNDTITVPKIMMRKRKIIYILDYDIVQNSGVHLKDRVWRNRYSLNYLHHHRIIYKKQ